jgi:hypothetical protein
MSERTIGWSGWCHPSHRLLPARRPYSQLVRIVLDPHPGTLLASSDTRDQDLASRIERYSVAVHFGLFGAPACSASVSRSSESCSASCPPC